MNYILKTLTNINGSYKPHYFKGWVGESSKHPEVTTKLNFAKQWKDKTNCKRFFLRNKEILGKLEFEVERIIAQRECEQCKKVINKDSRIDTKFCSESCRNKHFKQQAKNSDE